jgi:5-methylcytosine-specific restriction protein A
MWHGRGTAASRGYDYKWQKLRLRILERDNYLCQCPDCQCAGRIRPASEVDHVRPKAQGGTDDPSNLRAINRECQERVTLEQQGRKPKSKQRVGADGWPVGDGG